MWSKRHPLILEMTFTSLGRKNGRCRCSYSNKRIQPRKVMDFRSRDTKISNINHTRCLYFAFFCCCAKESSPVNLRCGFEVESSFELLRHLLWDWAYSAYRYLNFVWLIRLHDIKISLNIQGQHPCAKNTQWILIGSVNISKLFKMCSQQTFKFRRCCFCVSSTNLICSRFSVSSKQCTVNYVNSPTPKIELFRKIQLAQCKIANFSIPTNTIVRCVGILHQVKSAL